MRRTALTAVVILAAAHAAASEPRLNLADAQFRDEKLAERCRIEFAVDGDPGGLAVVFNHHDERNFAALLFGPSKAGEASVTLRETAGGKARTLPLGTATVSSGTIFLRPRHALVELGGRVFPAALTVAPGGRYGAASSGAGRFMSLVARREEPVYFTDDFMRAEGAGEHWQPLSGKWTIRAERDVTRSSNPFRCIARSEGVGLLVAGEATWHEYTVRASLAAASGSAGLAFAVRDDRNYHVFRLAAGRGASQLLRVRNGREEVLETSGQVLYPERWYTVSVRAEGAETVCCVDGIPLLRSRTAAPVGKVGLYVTDASETLFDDVAVAGTDLEEREAPPIELFSRVFESDEQMENWASLWSAWRPQQLASEGQRTRTVYWHKGDFFGDVSAGCRASARRTPEWQVGLVVGGDGEAPDRGAALTVRAAEGNEPLWTLSVDGKELKSGRTPVADDALISIARAGGRVVAKADSRVVLETGPVPLSGRSIAVWSDGVNVDLHKVEIRTRNVYDYLFEEAPCEWLARTGAWQITNRWVCDPRWSWLGGESRQVAQMWSKRAFYGDQTIEFFAALKMQAVGRYPHVGDINLTVCGDGRNLDSGYQVIFAGWGNQWTRLLRNGVTVAGSSDAVIEGNFHRRWFHVKLRKVGSLVQMFIDDELVRQYADPKPADGGQIALWTYDNGIMVARVRVYAERSELRPLLKSGAEAAAPPTGADEPAPQGYLVRNDFKKSAGRWANRDGEQGARLELLPAGGLLLVNENCGGSFAATVYDRTFDLLRYPIIDLGWKAVSEEPVCLNLFANVNGSLLELPLTAPPSESATTLEGAPKVVFHGTDGQVRRVRIDLGETVSAWYRNRFGRAPGGLYVRELYLANASNRKYLLCGFGGNRAGARVCISDFAIRSRDVEPEK